MLPSVREALSLPLIGHLDPVFIEIMEELSQGLR
jgi:aspartate aminotransferase-like enzyme